MSAKNIIVCCDGTGNEISENISNVLKFYRALRKTDKTRPRQVVFYDSGVGTLALPNPWIKLKQDFEALLGLATGYGIDDNLLKAYSFLIDNYVAGDNIYLFGFSRGAYTARMLAAIVHTVGILSPNQKNLAAAAIASYKASREKDDSGTFDGSQETQQNGAEDRAAQFARITSSHLPTIRFLGVWDTVASVIMPRPDRFYLPSLQQLAYTTRNPSVQTYREAMAIDERRRMFRLHGWAENQMFRSNRFSATNSSFPQDSMRMWFAGVHADIGGGYPEKESGLSKFSLLWMIEESEKNGLSFNAATVNQLARGAQRLGSPFRYVAPDAHGKLHKSLTAVWKLLEILPKRREHSEWPDRRIFAGVYFPLGEPRRVPSGALVHPSVWQRLQESDDYRPINLEEATSQT